MEQSGKLITKNLELLAKINQLAKPHPPVQRLRKNLRRDSTK
jgi:hypothetical protein